MNIYDKVAQIDAEGDVATGVNIVLKALEAPVRQIAENAGLEGSVIVERLKNAEVSVGFNALQMNGLTCWMQVSLIQQKFHVLHYNTRKCCGNVLNY